MNATLKTGWACFAAAFALTLAGGVVILNAPLYLAAFALGIVAAGQGEGGRATLLIIASALVPILAYAAVMG